MSTTAGPIRLVVVLRAEPGQYRGDGDQQDEKNPAVKS